MVMLSYALLMTCPFLMLRITGNGSFPKPLTSEEEKEYIDKYIAGDMEARNVLIERNLLHYLRYRVLIQKKLRM